MSCTDDVCRPGSSRAVAGCVHIPRDERCGEGSALSCAVAVCVGHETEAELDRATGCGLAYTTTCPARQICGPSGHCMAAPTRAPDAPCPDDTNPCTDALVCELAADGTGVGTCVPLPVDDACTGVSTCGTYCSASGCAVRTDGGGACVDASAL